MSADNFTRLTTWEGQVHIPTHSQMVLLLIVRVREGRGEGYGDDGGDSCDSCDGGDGGG